MKRICEYCGDDISNEKKKGTRYCCKDCQNKGSYHLKNPGATSLAIAKICKYCNKEYFNRNSLSKYCPNGCRELAMLQKKRDYERAKVKPKYCECGALIEGAGANRKLCDKCRKERFMQNEEEEEEPNKEIHIQPNGVEYYGMHGVIAKGVYNA